jgi:hypothetical protein
MENWEERNFGLDFVGHRDKFVIKNWNLLLIRSFVHYSLTKGTCGHLTARGWLEHKCKE